MVQHVNKEDDKDTEWCMKEEEGRNSEKTVTVTIFRKSNVYLTHMSPNLTFIQLFVDPFNGTRVQRQQISSLLIKLVIQSDSSHNVQTISRTFLLCKSLTLIKKNKTQQELKNKKNRPKANLKKKKNHQKKHITKKPN